MICMSTYMLTKTWGICARAGYILSCMYVYTAYMQEYEQPNEELHYIFFLILQHNSYLICSVCSLERRHISLAKDYIRES